MISVLLVSVGLTTRFKVATESQPPDVMSVKVYVPVAL
nr:hypothetical protein [uncultured bacterium]